MNRPEFTAEASSYKSSNSYIGSGSVYTYRDNQSQILPATIPWIFPWIVTGEIAKDCDATALQGLANRVCAQQAVAVMWSSGWTCTANCVASKFGHDSDCNPTGGNCSCQLDCTRSP